MKKNYPCRNQRDKLVFIYCSINIEWVTGLCGIFIKSCTSLLNNTFNICQYLYSCFSFFANTLFLKKFFVSVYSAGKPSFANPLILCSQTAFNSFYSIQQCCQKKVFTMHRLLQNMYESMDKRIDYSTSNTLCL